MTTAQDATGLSGRTAKMGEFPENSTIVLVHAAWADGYCWGTLFSPVAIVVVLAAWYAFRPERLLINRTVNEAMPAAQGASSAQPLESGQFYSILHPTDGTATIYQGRWVAASSPYELCYIKRSGCARLHGRGRRCKGRRDSEKGRLC
jgi:hypothetical protein